MTPPRDMLLFVWVVMALIEVVAVLGLLRAIDERAAAVGVTLMLVAVVVVLWLFPGGWVNANL